MNLSFFNTTNLFESATELFGLLNIKLNSNTTEPLPVRDLLKQHFKETEIFNSIEKTFYIGTLDNTVLGATVPPERDYKQAVEQADKNYEGLMLFALQLNKQPTRTEISELTRAFNRISQKMPVSLVLKYQVQNEAVISICISERFKYLQDWRQGEKAGKVIILRDIHTQTTHTGHLRILQDLVKPVGVTNYAQLHEHWLQVLDVSILNKKFYEELFKWYLWAVKNVEFPQIRPKEDLIPDEAHQSESVIRLLTRLLFCWFMKEKQQLIPEILFDENEAKRILKDFSTDKKKNSVYYRAVLQNLFFATLSVPIKDRKYLRESFQGKSSDHGNQYVFRYQDEFANSKENLKLFKDIPFLNGGLFDSLDKRKDDDNPIEIRLDGFSSNKKKQAFVPDFIFWGEHKGIDLSEEFDNPRKNNENVKGIFEILNDYKFTIEENTPLEEEIALDPDLLGRTFENLLASYNPETKTNARKQTGSFYTPREIVNYMVDESLLGYLKENVKIKDEADEKFRELISYSENKIRFSDEEKTKIVVAIENLKVLDPACGSGAFPMGILHKLVWLLHKIDPENKKWFESLINRFPEFTQSEMRKKLEGENWNYLRKLGLIQQSIYGIDIQPIAIQIAKLRFFISLIVDQKISDTPENNFGLLPLPNLDFKLVCANSLIEAPEGNKGFSLQFTDEFSENFTKATVRYFSAYLPKEKKKVTDEIKTLVNGKVTEKLKQIESHSKHSDERFSKYTAEKNKAVIEQKQRDAILWKSYSNLFKHESVGFFETKYFFPEVIDGFDIVIGNPPYVNTKRGIEETEKLYYKKNYLTAQGQFDIFCLFIEKSLKLGNQVCFIVPKPVINNENYLSTRELFFNNGLSQVVIGSGIFESAGVESCIFLANKKKQDEIKIFAFENENFNYKWDTSKKVSELLPFKMINTEITNSEFVIIQNIEKDSFRLGKILKITRGIEGGKSDEAITTNKTKYKLIRGEDLTTYAISFSNFYAKMDFSNPSKFKSNDVYSGEKIMIRRVGNDLIATYDSSDCVTLNTIYNCKVIHEKFNPKYITSLLNSSLLSFWFKKVFILTDKLFPYLRVSQLEFLPIKFAKDQKPFITLVDKIISAKKKNKDTTDLEKQIDEMVYKLYELTDEEIKVVEGKK